MEQFKKALKQKQINALGFDNEEPEMEQWRRNAIKKIDACTTLGQLIDFLIDDCGDDEMANAVDTILTYKCISKK